MNSCGPFFTLGVFVFATLSAGCRSQRIDNQANVQRAIARERADRQIAYSTCADGNKFGPNCGLIANRVVDADFRAKFREKYCTERPDDQCQTLFQRMIDAELSLRYFAADMRAVTVTCDLHPTECEDPHTYERYLLDSHNQHIREQLAKEENSIEEERERAQAEHVREGWAVAAAVGQTAAVVAEEARHPEGGLKCRTYPSVITGLGATTYCERR